MYSATGLAIVASMAMTLGLYFTKRAAEGLPSLAGGWRLAAWWAFVRDPWWMLGLLLQIAGFGLYLFTLSFAPLSIVHTALIGGIAFFVLLSVIGLGETVRPIEWAGVGLVVTALFALSLTLSGAPSARPGQRGMLPFSVVLLGLTAAAVFADQRPGRATGLSVGSGLMLGLGSMFAKNFATAGEANPQAMVAYLLLTLGANLLGFVWMQAAFQAGRGVVVMPIFSALSNLVPIIGGIVVFGEALPEQGAGVWLRPLAFVLAIAGAGLLAGFGERSGAATEAIAQTDEASSR